MGKNNRTRRREKRQDRASKARANQDQSGSHQTDQRGHQNKQPKADDSRPLSADEIERLFEATALTAPNRTAEQRGFDALLVCHPALIARGAQACLLRRVPLAWRNGWQPTELHRQIKRGSNATGAKLALGLIANDHTGRDPATLDPRWATQLASLRIPASVDPDWIVHWVEGSTIDQFAFLGLLLDMLKTIGHLRAMTVLIPPPGTGTADLIDLNTRLDDPMLDRVRALLAKAESTEFEAEAEAFTAKAQELMARYSIDAAMLSARTTNSDQPVTIRIPIDDPYADAKSLLCQIVATHSRCRAVRIPEYGVSTVVGFPSDLAATEILFTSLLVQAQAAMQSSTAAAESGARSRSSSFRTAFLLAYAHRVGERLDEINTHVTAAAEADIGTSLVPVLAARGAAVDDAVTEQFGNLSESRPRGGRDAAGWASGTLAADRAKLNLADLPGPPRTRATDSAVLPRS